MIIYIRMILEICDLETYEEYGRIVAEDNNEVSAITFRTMQQSLYKCC